MSSLVERRAAATESRLAIVLQQLVRLAEETDPNPQTRAAALRAERERLDRQIEAVEGGRSPPITEIRALERAREIISLSTELIADFHRVRDDFEQLNRGLRERLLDTDAKEQRRLNQILREAQSAALTLKEHVRATEEIGYTLGYLKWL